MIADTSRLRAPAKLTLSLRVERLRPDGFHELDALAVMLDVPHDELFVTPRATPGVELVVEGGEADIPPGSDNLVVRAADAVLPLGEVRGLSVRLVKRVPSGGGLGGGSADAAAILRWAREVGGAEPAVVARAAAEIGSDVPVCLLGRAARMRGRGEALDPVELDGPVLGVVVVPPFRLATPAVYRAWDALGGPRSMRVLPAPMAVAALVDGLVNDLEPAAEVVEPAVRAFRERIEVLSARPALLAGSGSAHFVPCDTTEAAAETAARVSAAGITAWAVRTEI